MCIVSWDFHSLSIGTFCIVSDSFFPFWTVLKQGCHGQGKVREKQKFFKVREKSGNFAKSQGKSQFLSKSVKSQGILSNALRSKSREKCKEMEHEEKNIDGLQKKLKLM